MDYVAELIREYGELTGRGPGWEKYMSVADYIEFKKAAVQLAPSAPVQQYNHNQSVYQSAPTHSVPVLSRATTETTETTMCPINEPVNQKSIQTPPISRQSGSFSSQDSDELDELAIFKSMGSGLD